MNIGAQKILKPLASNGDLQLPDLSFVALDIPINMILLMFRKKLYEYMKMLRLISYVIPLFFSFFFSRMLL
jgi:hypothetical protein